MNFLLYAIFAGLQLEYILKLRILYNFPGHILVSAVLDCMIKWLPFALFPVDQLLHTTCNSFRSTFSYYVLKYFITLLTIAIILHFICLSFT